MVQGRVLAGADVMQTGWPDADVRSDHDAVVQAIRFVASMLMLFRILLKFAEVPMRKALAKDLVCLPLQLGIGLPYGSHACAPFALTSLHGLYTVSAQNKSGFGGTVDLMNFLHEHSLRIAGDGLVPRDGI